MSIRRLLGILLLVFAGLSGAAGIWQLSDSMQKMQAADWVVRVNHLADLTHQLNAELAMERGITAAILGQPAAASSVLRAQMFNARGRVDRQYQVFHEYLQELLAVAPQHPMANALTELEQAARQQTLLREQVDLAIVGIASAVTHREWIDALTGRIRILQNFVVVSMLPLPANPYALASVQVFRDQLFSLSEHLGQERAVLGAAIASARPLQDSDRAQLVSARMVVERASARFLEAAPYMPHDPRLEDALLQMRDHLLSDYHPLREQVFTASLAGQGYPVTPEEWYRQATTAIDQVLEVSRLISQRSPTDITSLRDSARQTLWLLAWVVLALTLLFGFTVYAVRQRLLLPLGLLERAARQVASGDLQQPVLALRDDEMGHLAHAMEQMRQSLLDDRVRRETDAERLRKLNALIDNSASAMVITDLQGNIEYVNQRFEVTTGYSPAESIGRKAGFWGSGLTARDQYQLMWQTALNGRVWEGEMINRRKDGELFWCSVSISPVIDDQGQVTHLIGAHVDISELKQIQRQLDVLRNYDELTHLPNRRLFSEYFQRVAEQQARRGGYCAVLAIGISRFKQFNDSLGREAGDQLLQRLALRLRQAAGKRDTVARFAGTDFHMLLVDLESPAVLFERVSTLLAHANRPLSIHGQDVKPALRAGCSLLAEHGRDLETLMRKAGTALHSAERRGHEQALYDESLGHDAEQRLLIENALRLAIERDQLELHYQPKVELASGRIIGVEALARWRDRTTGEWIAPDRFIAVAEESGLILVLGAWALREACRQNREWAAQGLPPLVVAVNLFAVQLQQSDLPSVVRRILAETGMPAEYLELELTESAIMEYPEQANLLLRELKSLGVKLSIDDFGTGYSSLAYLSRFPVDLLKIDRSFINALEQDSSAAAIATSIIAMAHQLGLQVIAEGVETERQLAFLQRHGCDQIQGYYFSKPLAAADLGWLLTQDRRLQMPEAVSFKRTLLMVDDDPLIQVGLQQALDGQGYRLLSCTTAREALELMACNDIQVVLADDHMPDMSGTELLARIKNLYPDTVRLMFSGYFDARRLKDAINIGSIYKYISKPWEQGHLRRCVDDAFAHHASLQRRLQQEDPSSRLHGEDGPTGG